MKMRKRWRFGGISISIAMEATFRRGRLCLRVLGKLRKWLVIHTCTLIPHLLRLMNSFAFITPLRLWKESAPSWLLRLEMVIGFLFEIGSSKRNHITVQRPGLVRWRVRIVDGEHFWGVLHPGHVLVKTNQHPHLRPSGGVSDQLDEGFFNFSFVTFILQYICSFGLLELLPNFRRYSSWYYGVCFR